MPREKREPLDRFCALTKKTDSCWLWLGSKNPDGYGKFHLKGKSIAAHRFIFSQTYKFNLVSSQLVLHKCDVRNCVNPEHLFLGSQLDNVRDCIIKGRFKYNFKKNKGEGHYAAKLKSKDIVLIRKLYSETKISQTKLAKQFKISNSLVWLIINRKIWKEV